MGCDLAPSPPRCINKLLQYKYAKLDTQAGNPVLTGALNNKLHYTQVRNYTYTKLNQVKNLKTEIYV